MEFSGKHLLRDICVAEISQRLLLVKHALKGSLLSHSWSAQVVSRKCWKGAPLAKTTSGARNLFLISCLSVSNDRVLAHRKVHRFENQCRFRFGYNNLLGGFHGENRTFSGLRQVSQAARVSNQFPGSLLPPRPRPRASSSSAMEVVPCLVLDHHD